MLPSLRKGLPHAATPPTPIRLLKFGKFSATLLVLGSTMRKSMQSMASGSATSYPEVPESQISDCPDARICGTKHAIQAVGLRPSPTLSTWPAVPRNSLGPGMIMRVLYHIAASDHSSCVTV